MVYINTRLNAFLREERISKQNGGIISAEVMLYMTINFDLSHKNHQLTMVVI